MSEWGRIVFPPAAPGVRTGKHFQVVCRAATPDVLAVTAEVTGTAGEAPGVLLRTTSDRDPGRPAVWVFEFLVEPAGAATYRVTAQGYGTAGPVGKPEAREVTVAPRAAGAALPKAINLSYPGDDADITAEKDNFVAYGEYLDEHDAVLALMNAVESTSLVSSDGWWSAYFPPLDVNTYTLLVVDSENHSATATGLTVTG